MVSLTEYQRFVADGYTNPNGDLRDMFFNAGLGICGEAGEVADLIKKKLHGRFIPNDKFVEEIGDVVWYLTHLCHLLGISLEDVIVGNFEKLSLRYPEYHEGKYYEVEVIDHEQSS